MRSSGIALAAFAFAAASIGALAPRTAGAWCDCTLTFVRLGPHPIVLANVSDAVAAIVHDRLPDADAQVRLEREGLHELAGSLATLPRRAQRVELRLLYNKVGAVSPVYGAETFAGVERYGVLELDGPSLMHDRDRWRELDAKSPIPAWVRFRLTGTLPDR